MNNQEAWINRVCDSDAFLGMVIFRWGLLAVS